MSILSSISGAARDAASWVGEQIDHIEDAGQQALDGAEQAREWVGERLDDLDAAKQQAGQAIEDAVRGAEQGIDDFRAGVVRFGADHGGVVGERLAQQVSDSIGLVEGAGLAVYDIGKGVVQLADGASQLASPLEWVARPQNNLGRIEATGNTLGTMARLGSPVAWALDPQSNAQAAGALWDGLTVGYQDAANDGDWAKFGGRAVLDVGSLFIGVGEVNAGLKATQGASALGRIGEGAQLAGRLDAAADLGRIAEGARGADAAADAGRGLQGLHGAPATGPLDDLLRQADTGVTVAGKPLLRFESLDDFNTAANAARPNTVYEFGSYRWSTDELGRIERAEGKVDLTPLGRNDSKLQAAIGNEGRATDVGFHLIADRFNAPTNRLNVVPGNGKPIGDKLPNLNNGAYKRFENTIADLRAKGSEVEIRVSAEYNPGNLSNRPDTFIAEYRVDGGRWVNQEFANK